MKSHTTVKARGIEELGTRFSETLRRALDKVKRRKPEELEKKLEAMHGALEKIDVERVVKGIREDRER